MINMRVSGELIPEQSQQCHSEIIVGATVTLLVSLLEQVLPCVFLLYTGCPQCDVTGFFDGRGATLTVNHNVKFSS